jgi:hypothetical protein
MTNGERLLHALCDALGFDVEAEVITNTAGQIQEGQYEYKVTKRQPKKRSKADMGYSDDFLYLWSIKPHRDGNSKPEAFKEYGAKIKGGEFYMLIRQGLERYAAYVKAIGTDEWTYKLSNFIKNEHYLSKWAIPEKATKLFIPKDNEKLKQFCIDNDLPKDKPGEYYPEWRQRIADAIEKRSN